MLSIIVPVFNKFAFTKSCLNDLLKLDKSIHQIIIVDDCSTDETQKELENNKDIFYIRNDTNKGFSKSCNAGYKIAKYNNILFLNNDIRVIKDHEFWTNEIIQNCELGIVGPTTGELDKNFNFIREHNSIIKSKYSYMSGWCLASSKNIFNKLIINNYNGPFSEEFGFYFEDTDLGFRSSEIKINFINVKIPVVHFGKISSKQLNTSLLYNNSRKIFIKKWKDRIK